MRLPEKMRALICYAGSAPEASIGSKPIGNELENYISLIGGQCQEFLKIIRCLEPCEYCKKFLQPIDIYMKMVAAIEGKTSS